MSRSAPIADSKNLMFILQLSDDVLRPEARANYSWHCHAKTSIFECPCAH